MIAAFSGTVAVVANRRATQASANAQNSEAAATESASWINEFRALYGTLKAEHLECKADLRIAKTMIVDLETRVRRLEQS